MICLSLLSFVSCQKKEPGYIPGANCKQSLVLDSFQLHWTAYKFTERVSVQGEVQQVEIQNQQGVELQKLLSSLQLKFNLGQIHSDLAERDANVRTHFVSQMAEGGSVQAVVKSVTGNQIWIALRMNGIEKQIPMDWSVEQGKLWATGKLELDSFGLKPAMDQLSKAVAPMHTGSDGIAMMWPDLDLSLSAPLSSECQE